MGNERRRGLILAAVYALLVIMLLIGGGLYVRALIGGTFSTAADLGATRGLAYQSLKYMLDEETGLRGFAATHDPLFLEPYAQARAPFAANERRLRAGVATLGDASAIAAVDDTIALHSRYLRTVAPPLLAPHGRDTLAVELRGKVLVDRFRADITRIDAIVAERQQLVGDQVRSAIDRIGLLTGGAVVLVLLVSLLYAVQQASLAERVQAERIRAARQKREAEVLRAAYQTEKRIADTLQEAFVQRPLPTHPTFRFSATYVPASEESNVGGDWYDALELPGNRVLFAIGDVTGHGIDAAVTMNRVRQALISSACSTRCPRGCSTASRRNSTPTRRRS